MPQGVLVQVQSRAPDHDNFDYFRPQGVFFIAERRCLRVGYYSSWVGGERRGGPKMFDFCQNFGR